MSFFPSPVAQATAQRWSHKCVSPPGGLQHDFALQTLNSVTLTRAASSWRRCLAVDGGESGLQCKACLLVVPAHWLAAHSQAVVWLVGNVWGRVKDSPSVHLQVNVSPIDDETDLCTDSHYACSLFLHVGCRASRCEVETQHVEHVPFFYLASWSCVQITGWRFAAPAHQRRRVGGWARGEEWGSRDKGLTRWMTAGAEKKPAKVITVTKSCKNKAGCPVASLSVFFFFYLRGKEATVAAAAILTLGYFRTKPAGVPL